MRGILVASWVLLLGGCAGAMDDLPGGALPPGPDNPGDPSGTGPAPGAAPGWAAALSSAEVAGLAVHGGTVYAAATKQDGMYVARIDEVTGGVQEERVLVADGAVTSRTVALALAGGNLVVGGLAKNAAGSQRMVLATLTPALAEVDQQQVDDGNGGGDELWDVAAATSGAPWLAGTVKLGTAPRPHVYRAQSGYNCASDVLGRAGLIRGIHVDPATGTAYVTGASAGEAFLAAYDAAACAPPSCGGCQPQWQFRFTDEGRNTVGMDIITVGSSVYVVGISSVDGGDQHTGRAFIARVDPLAQQVLQTASWDPSSQTDGYVTAASDGSGIYVAGARDWAGPDSSPRAVVQRWTLDLQQQWSTVTADVGVFSSIATVDSGVVVGGADRGSGIVRRCTASGSCE